MLTCYTEKKEASVPIIALKFDDFSNWREQQTDFVKQWCEANHFEAKANTHCCVPSDNGTIAFVLFGKSDVDRFWDGADLASRLPEGIYHLSEPSDSFAIAWGLGAYQFSRYKKNNKQMAQLVLADAQSHCSTLVEAHYLVRDLVNTPTEDMGPYELAEAAKTLSDRFSGQFSVIMGQQLLQNNFPAIHAVGRASPNEPRLIDFTWGDESNPKITLVGKGVCFDTGGLDLKPSRAMLTMKKDMGGAAHVLGLAQLIMASNLAIRLRVIIPAVENAVSGNAYRPGDVIPSRSGQTIEIGNTDAEGRVILGDALSLASEENPDLIIDIATLTGAARIAMGLDVPAMFCNNDEKANALITASQQCDDPIWRMPLHQPYRELIKSKLADLNNAGSSPYGGAITAALFLESFIGKDIPWMHLDLMAYNTGSRPGRPEGGEAMALRALFAFLQANY